VAVGVGGRCPGGADGSRPSKRAVLERNGQVLRVGQDQLAGPAGFDEALEVQVRNPLVIDVDRIRRNPQQRIRL
jgi:hypothetical protein